ncbi:MAG: DUF2807 domain-containing protein [Ferruginibacter sp.]|nr:DUF2807 domain-containing protein [Cytophagales bacterium]
MAHASHGPSIAALTVLVCLLHAAAFAQVKQSRNVGAFRGVQAGGALRVFIKPGSPQSVTVETDGDLQSRIITEVDGEVLKIHREKKFNWKSRGNQPVNVYLTCPELTSLDVSGATDVRGASAFVANDFRLAVSGASDVTLALSAKTLRATVSGASELTLTGRADNQRVNLSGASDYRGYGLQSHRAEVETSGSSDAQVSVDEELKVGASGASDVRYKGKPRVRNVQSSGSGSVRRAG